MGQTTIEWCDFTFNPWHGCVKVSPGCTHCYAEAFDRRVNGTVRHVDSTGNDREPHWGKDAPRRFFGDAHWREPLKWNRDAQKAGERRRVFCASMADVFEDRPDLVGPRFRLMNLVWHTQALDWLVLTKRPENIARLLVEAADWGKEHSSLDHIALREWGEGRGKPFPNVWLGTTVENQEQADLRVPKLLRVPAAVRFLSVEPLLEAVNLEANKMGVRPWHDETWLGVDWVIVGGESGPGARPCDVAWIRSVVEQCREAGTACFVKQIGAVVHDRNDAGFDAESETWADGPDAGQPTMPSAWPEPIDVEDAEYQSHQGAAVRVRLSDPKGGDPAEWPADLRVRQFPEARS